MPGVQRKAQRPAQRNVQRCRSRIAGGLRRRGGGGCGQQGSCRQTQQRTLENSGGRRDGSQQIGQQKNETSIDITMVDGSASSQGPGGQTPQRKGGLVSRMWACEDGRPPRVESGRAGCRGGGSAAVDHTPPSAKRGGAVTAGAWCVGAFRACQRLVQSVWGKTNCSLSGFNTRLYTSGSIGWYCG